MALINKSTVCTGRSYNAFGGETRRRVAAEKDADDGTSECHPRL